MIWVIGAVVVKLAKTELLPEAMPLSSDSSCAPVKVAAPLLVTMLMVLEGSTDPQVNETSDALLVRSKTAKPPL
jgi:hypothetical protein